MVMFLLYVYLYSRLVKNNTAHMVTSKRHKNMKTPTCGAHIFMNFCNLKKPKE